MTTPSQNQKGSDVTTCYTNKIQKTLDTDANIQHKDKTTFQTPVPNQKVSFVSTVDCGKVQTTLDMPSQYFKTCAFLVWKDSKEIILYTNDVDENIDIEKCNMTTYVNEIDNQMEIKTHNQGTT